MRAYRVSRDAMLVEIANVVAKRGTCTRGFIGAVIAHEGRVISTGYVGSPSGQPHCTDVGCDIGPDGGCQRTVHAEANAFAFAAKYGLATDGSTIYTLKAPCVSCAKLIINSGIQRVVYVSTYRDPRGLRMLEESGLQVDRF